MGHHNLLGLDAKKVKAPPGGGAFSKKLVSKPREHCAKWTSRPWELLRGSGRRRTLKISFALVFVLRIKLLRTHGARNFFTRGGVLDGLILASGPGFRREWESALGRDRGHLHTSLIIYLALTGADWLLSCFKR